MKIKSFDALNDAYKKNELDRFNTFSYEQKVTFLKAKGHSIGQSLFDAEKLDLATEILQEAFCPPRKERM